MIGKLLTSPSGKIVISIIWGLGLAALFRRACNGRSCIVYMGPHPSNVQGKVFKHGEKCHKYSMKRSNCDSVDDNNVYVDKDVHANNKNNNKNK